ncbi:MAG: hypothetical protein ACUVXI_10485, partial [bacterium]
VPQMIEKFYGNNLKGNITGFHYLDGHPLVHDGVGFVGSIGWYDYSFRELDPPFAEDTEILRIGPKRELEGISWSDLTDADYARKELFYFYRGNGMRVRWNDRLYVRWNLSDEEFLEENLAELEGHIEGIYPEVRSIVAILHHLPFEEEIIRKPQDPGWTFCNAFMGSSKLGELLLRYEKVRHVLVGHAHRRNHLAMGHIDVLNSSFDHRDPEPIEIIV